MFCCMLLYVHSSIAIILMGKRELVALLNLSSWCLVMVERLFLAVPRGCLQFVLVVFPDHTHLLLYHQNVFYDFFHFLKKKSYSMNRCDMGWVRFRKVDGFTDAEVISFCFLVLFVFYFKKYNIL